ncbi:MAG: hypothetical protein RMN52_11950 [Anaerolineae bacterium]|nr:hypothetical protein [Candidatus Roseilinea sp.]MDW8450703.1 hypothetical protein [Anaerolineae bacterium]
MADSTPRLRMGFTRFDRLAPPQPAAGYGLAHFAPATRKTGSPCSAC